MQAAANLEIVSQTFFAEGQIQLIDLAGRTVDNIYQGPIDFGLSEFKLDWQALPAGYYILSIKTGEQLHHQKVLIREK